MENAIGKLMYIGKNFKGELENGKIYDCLDLSFGQVKIIDDTNKAFWYSARTRAATAERITAHGLSLKITVLTIC